MLTNKQILSLNFKLAAAVRNFPWPAKARCRNFRPISTEPKAKIRVLVMTTPKCFIDAIWAAYTFIYWHGPDFDLRIVVDGDAPTKIAATLKAVLPKAKLIEGTDSLGQLTGYEKLQEFSIKSKFGRKLLNICTQNQDKSLIYFDSDVLFFNRGSEVNSWNDSSCFQFVCDGSTANEYPQRNEELKRVLDGSPEKGFNSGFMMIPKATLELPLVDKALCATHQKANGHPIDGHFDGRLFYEGWEYFTDQALFSHFAGRMTSHQLPSDLYDHSGAGLFVLGKDKTDYDRIVLRHFTGNVRHRMYLTGIPKAYDRILSASF